jgi:AAA domain
MANDIDFGALIGPVAKRLWGNPNRAHSKPNELRWGTNGSKSVNLFKGTFFDHESNEGGGALDLIKRETGREGADAVAWLREQGLINGADTSSSLGDPTAVYPYVDEGGELLFQVCRYGNGASKTFRQRRPNGGGAWEYSLKGVRRVLYKLPQLAEALMQRLPIIVVEGEKDADTLARHNFPATTNPGGAGNWRSDYNEFLRGADVILVPDSDEPGRAHMQTVAGELNGVAKSVRILTLPALPDKGDVSDWLANGGSADKLRDLIASAPGFAPAKAKPLTVRWHRDTNNPTPRAPGLLSGQSGTFKTFVGISLAGAVATGKTFIGYRVKRPGAVLAFVSEGASGWPQRLDALSKHDHDNAKLPISFTSEPVSLLDATSLAAVVETVKSTAEEIKRDRDLPLVLVIFDTLIGAAGFTKAGDENDAVVNAKLMNALALIARETGTFVLGIDHFGKAVETGTRGSSAKEASADIVLGLLANKSISGGISEQRLAIRKRRDGQAGIEHSFAVDTVELGEDEDGDPIRSLAVTFSTTPAAPPVKEADGWTKSLQTLKRILMTLLADCGEDILPYADSPGTVRAIKSDTVRAEFYRQYLADGAGAKSVRAGGEGGPGQRSDRYPRDRRNPIYMACSKNNNLAPGQPGHTRTFVRFVRLCPVALTRVRTPDGRTGRL